MIGLMIGLAVAAGNDDSQTVRPLPSPAEARAAIVSCGVGRKSVSVKFERELQDEIVWVAADSGALAEPVLTCIARQSLETNYNVYFRDQAVQKRYNPIYGRLGREVEVAQARKWLRAHELLAKVPTLAQGEPLSSYTKAVERFCGVREGALLTTPNEQFVTFVKNGLGHFTGNGLEDRAANDAQFYCVMNTITAEDLESRGIFFGFVGNAMPEDRQNR